MATRTAQEVSPKGKKIYVPVHVEPKVYFAAEDIPRIGMSHIPLVLDVRNILGLQWEYSIHWHHYRHAAQL